jgi:ferredoxin
MNVQVFRERCCGSGNCAMTAPDVFDLDADEGRVLLRLPELPVEQLEPVKRAVHECPTAAIELR